MQEPAKPRRCLLLRRPTMRHQLILSLILPLATTAAIAQTAPSDSQLTQSMLAEVRQLRNDLQTAAATIQRVQIVMYRLYAQATVLDRATQRFERARTSCSQTQRQRKTIASQIEQMEAADRGARVPSEMLSNFRAMAESLATEE